MQYAAKTHVGLVRQLNEDVYTVDTQLEPYGVAVVADGMGGHLAGEVASALALETVLTQFKEQAANEEDPADLVVAAMQSANRAVHERANSSERLNGMGTTLVACLFDEQHIYLGHIGDSRGYLYQAGNLRQLTDDHTLVNELYKSGQITAEEAQHHPQRNIVTRAVGTDSKVQADLLHMEWSAGDILLLCSDGLTDMVDQKRLSAIVSGDQTLDAKVDALIDAALASGGHDNITVVAVQNQSERGDAR
ncbi:MAG: Stp1/IreP family PP2C-type Ser/Thr phosphatase, partial [Tumebacillaceae bacterium]